MRQDNNEAASALRKALQELADAAEDFAGSEPDMPSHADAEKRFDAALEDARQVLANNPKE